ncbi:hypothetical protein MARA_16330 [Mycolicibacterium arabiense]|uniref:LysM domain-containing protein n=1 Tax=Mycolicibacterium arabiense TaxID=1286181 RepID=A0A7I7RWN0_9MYCO|nr:LysM peptidoglycan-binding domain-containing protein [Mycolicibacterium arabiense]MCV7373535.1 LysM peptidoglycan-binding domain-containing protein [Mycolicibacterium arabiense]BBY48165.1 hypothetical protein MARA_16330 [Mycolicibacterium arabiense]
MTIITREYPTEIVARPVRPRPDVRRGPQRRRPANEPLRYRGTGVLMSRASNRRKPITPATTVLLALVAAAITVWLGLVAQFGAPAETPAPGQLAVVQVQTGESLQQLAQRVAPDAPVAAVVDQIRELNELSSAGVDAGQTLIAPVA